MLVRVDASSQDEYRKLCNDEPNAARRLNLCLRGRDVPPDLVQPMCDFLDAVAKLLDASV